MWIIIIRVDTQTILPLGCMFSIVSNHYVREVNRHNALQGHSYKYTMVQYLQRTPYDTHIHMYTSYWYT